MTHYSNTSNPVDFPKLSTVDRLWGKALDQAVPDTYSSLSWTQVERIKAVFAESIVQEMLEITDAHTEVFQTDRDRALIEHIKQSVKTHFGVEL